jgi:hypothetical protein
VRLIINHLTRMQERFICVAGIDPATRQHIRLVLRSRMTTASLARNGGAFDMARVVNLGAVDHVGVAPEVEDCLFAPARISDSSPMPAHEFWSLLESVSGDAIGSLFGDTLARFGATFAAELGTGTRSLGCLRPHYPPELLTTEGRIRLRIREGPGTVSLPVTDLRLYDPRLQAPRLALADGIAARIRAGVPVILSVGLTRPWTRPGDTVARHWLQVNNIHLQDHPAWTDASGQPADDLPF